MQRPNVLPSFSAFGLTVQKLPPSTLPMVAATKKQKIVAPPILRVAPPRFRPRSHRVNPLHPAKFRRNWLGGSKVIASNGLSWWVVVLRIRVF